MRELDSAHTKLESNLKKAKGLDKLKTDADKAGKSAQTTSKTVTGLSQSTTKYDRDADKASKSVKKMTQELEAATGASRGLLGSLSKGLSIGSPGGPGGGLFGGGLLPGLSNISSIIRGIPQIGNLAHAMISPLTEAAEEGIRLNMTLEQAEIGFSQVAGSADKAHEHLMKLQAFGAASPFDFEGLLTASRLMTTMGFELDEQIPKLRVIGNAIAASGSLSEEAVQRVVMALGQMRMAGRVNAQDMNQLTNANIPGWQLLAKAIGKTVAETRKLAENGKLNGKVAVEAMIAMMAVDKRFEGMMEKLEGTTGGRLSAFKDNFKIAAGVAMQGTTINFSNLLKDALERPELLPELATRINTMLTPIGALIETSVKTVLTPGITTGFADGIKAGKKIVKDALIDMAEESILGTVKNLLGIQSPSTVFIGYGLDSAQGYSIGFTVGMQQAERDILGGLSGSLDKIEQFLKSRVGRVFGADIEKLIKENAAKWKVPEDLIRAVMETESAGNPNAVSPKGATGLMQLMAATAKRFGVKNRKDPAQSISGGTQYLRFLMDLFGPDNLELVLAGYNAGEGAVKKYGNKVPPYAETQAYVKKIMPRLRGGTASASSVLPTTTLGPDWSNGPTFMGQSPQQLQDLLTPADLAAQKQIADLIKSTMDRIAVVNQQITQGQKSIAGAPQLAPGAPGYDEQMRSGLRLNRLQVESELLQKSLSQLNVEMQQLIQSTISLRLAEKADLDKFRSTQDYSGNAAPLGQELLSTSFIDPNLMTLNIRPTQKVLVEVVEVAKKLADELERGGDAALKLGPGQWYEAATAIGSMQERLSAMFDELPTTRRFMEDIFISIPSRFGDVMGNAVMQADGTLKSFWSAAKEDAVNMFRQMAAEITRQMTTRLMSKLFVSALGTPEMDAQTGEATGGVKGGWGWLKKLGGWLGGSGTPQKRAGGGAVFAGNPVVVGDHPFNRPNPEIFIPKTDGQITPVSQLLGGQRGQQGIGNPTPVSNPTIPIVLVDDERTAREHYNTSDRAYVRKVRRNRKLNI